MIRFSILILALCFGSYAQFEAREHLEFKAHVKGASKALRTQFVQKITHLGKECEEFKNCSDAVIFCLEREPSRKMEDSISEVIYSEFRNIRN